MNDLHQKIELVTFRTETYIFIAQPRYSPYDLATKWQWSNFGVEKSNGGTRGKPRWAMTFLKIIWTAIGPAYLMLTFICTLVFIKKYLICYKFINDAVYVYKSCILISCYKYLKFLCITYYGLWFLNYKLISKNRDGKIKIILVRATPNLRLDLFFGSIII